VTAAADRSIAEAGVIKATPVSARIKTTTKLAKHARRAVIMAWPRGSALSGRRV
jgi:hypothetical protein